MSMSGSSTVLSNPKRDGCKYSAAPGQNLRANSAPGEIFEKAFFLLGYLKRHEIHLKVFLKGFLRVVIPRKHVIFCALISRSLSVASSFKPFLRFGNFIKVSPRSFPQK